jgi:hypothetical protein
MNPLDKPLAIDLFCGLGGWTEGLLAEGYDVVGFDIERHQYKKLVEATRADECWWDDERRWRDDKEAGIRRARPKSMKSVLLRYPAQLVLQDVLTLHGSQFRNAALIVASPPCQEYSYRAMPWKRAKALPPPSNELFEACFRIQREASEAASHHIPMVVENVKGAQPWVGRAAWHYGSFYLWGDVPALMPSTRALKITGYSDPRRNGGGHSQNPVTGEGLKVPGIKLSEVGFNVAAAQRYREGVKQQGSGAELFDKGIVRHSSRSDSRKAASAQIAKIPFELARWIAYCYR